MSDMNQELKQAICEVLHEVFETMFFPILAPSPCLSPAEDEGAVEELFMADEIYVKSAIAFQGPRTGRFHLYLPYGLAHSITINFLGYSEKENLYMDQILETANMTIGCLLSRIDPSGKCRLQIPQATALDALAGEEEAADSPGHRLRLNTELGTILVIFRD